MKIWDKWKNGFLGILWQPIVRFSQTTPQFIQKLYDEYFPNKFFKNLVSHGDWGLVQRFEAAGPKMAFST